MSNLSPKGRARLVRTRSILISLLSFFAAQLSADEAQSMLKWSGLEQVIVTDPLDEVVIVYFAYENLSDSAIIIREIRSDCDCLLVDGEPRLVKAGEKGQISAKFTVGTRFGVNERILKVFIGEADEALALPFTVKVPERIAVSPRKLNWVRGGDSASLRIRLEVRDEPFRILNVKPTNRAFAVEMIELEDGQGFELIVEPASTMIPRSSFLMIETDQPDEPWSRLMIPLRIS